MLYKPNAKRSVPRKDIGNITGAVTLANYYNKLVNKTQGLTIKYNVCNKATVNLYIHAIKTKYVT